MLTTFALVSGWLIPRGPVTTGQALTAMTVALAVGIVAGADTGSRWAPLLAPLIFVMIFELARISADGPTVDALSGGTFLAWAAFLLARPVHGLLVFVPLTAGILYGVDLAARRGRPAARRLRTAGWIAAVALGLAAAALGFAVSRPADPAAQAGARRAAVERLPPTWHRPDHERIARPVGAGGLAGPVVAAIIAAAAIDGRSGISALWNGLRRWCVGAWCLLLLAPLAVGAAAVSIAVAVNPAELDASGLSDWIGRFRRFWDSSLDRLDAHLAAVQAAERTDTKEH